MNAEELKEVLERHLHWLKEDCEEWRDMRADLYGANLRGANLREANLCGADLRGADLYGANLREANLYGANLCGANLREADLYGATLYEVTLYEANLRGANLREADLYGATLYEANLRGANLREADLYGANLPIACPDTGAFIGWKKVDIVGRNAKAIVKLMIPEDAKRSSATTRKCRCDKAKVLEIQSFVGEPLTQERVVSNYDSKFEYIAGEEVSVCDFDEDRWNECSTGIHFFITRQEAVDY